MGDHAMLAKAVPAIVVNMPLTTTTKRLKIRNDEAARRQIADTDGARRRYSQLAERNRLI